MDASITTLVLTSGIHRQILDHLQSGLPNEGCGLLATVSFPMAADVDCGVHFFPGTNVNASPTRYTMEPREVLDAHTAIRERGWQLGAIVHSHPQTAPAPSATDLREYFYPGTLLVIVGFGSGVPEMRAWRIEGSPEAWQPVEVALVIQPG